MTIILCEKLRICAAELRDGLGRTLIGDTADEAADTIEELVEALARCRRFFVSKWGADEAESCLTELDTLLAKLGNPQ